MTDQIRNETVETVYKGWAELTRATFDYRRSDGAWQTQVRETFDRGHGAAILLFNRARRSVVLTRQFRYPVHVAGGSGFLIEACAGLLDEDDPETCIRKESAEETGYRVHDVRRILTAYTTPGSVTERLYLFVAEYDPDDVSEGGGVVSEGEDIEVLEMPFDDALAMIDDGRIEDAKTIMLLQYAALHGLLDD